MNNGVQKPPFAHFRLWLQTATALALIGFPFAVYFGITYWGITIIAPVMLLLFTLRLTLAQAKLRELAWLLKAVAVIGGLLALASWGLKQTQWLLYYPVLVNLALLLLFGHSLFKPPTLVERLARLSEPDLPPQAIVYTRRVSQVWCLFFIINGSIALYTCLSGDIKLWTLYNGAISYLLIGILMSVEWLIRKIIQRA